MTRIKDLNRKSKMNNNDILPVWDGHSSSTRSVSFDNLRKAVPYVESAVYDEPFLTITQSNGEKFAVEIKTGGSVISSLLDGQVPVKDDETGDLIYSGATVNQETGVWTFDRTIEVPNSSLDVGEVVTISEGSTTLLVSNNIDDIVSAVVTSDLKRSGAEQPSFFRFGAEKTFTPQPDDSEVITDNPLIASSTGRVEEPNIRQINQTIFRASEPMGNVVAEIKDKASGVVIKYIPSRAAWHAETEEEKLRNPGLNFVAGDNVIDFVSKEDDTPGVFNIGVSPFVLSRGQEFEIIIKADNMALKGVSGVPYLSEMVQDGPEVKLLSEDDQYIKDIVAGNNVIIDKTDPYNPVISASGGSGAGITVDVDNVEITTGVDTLNFDSNSIQLTNDGANKVTIAAKVQPTNYVGIFETVAQLQASYPTPEDGLYADIINENNNKPPSRYESQSNTWVGLGGIPGDVIVNDIKSLGIIAGDGLKYEDDGGSAKLSVSGNIPVTTFDVTKDSTRNVDESYVGGVISIIQTPPAISIPMQIYISDHSAFEVGDVIKIGADRDGENAYTNYYFAVYYNDAAGRNLVRYPANNITMIRTFSSWDVQLDGRFTNVSIRPRSEFNIPYEADEQYSTPVNAFVFAESNAVEFDVDEDSNTRIVKIDLDAINPDNPTFKTVSLDTAGSGQPNFTSVIKQDSELHTVIDATRELRVNYKDIGTGTTTTVFGIDNTQAQFLVPIMQGNDPVALAKDIPSFPDNGYIEKYTRADTNYIQVAYQGKYGDDRKFYPSAFNQDGNGWTWIKFTGNMVFECRDKNDGAVLSKPFEVGQTRCTFNVQPYYGTEKVATRTNNHITNTASFNDLIYTNGQNVNEWIADNPDYTPAQLLDVIFDCKVLGQTNWIVSATTSNNNYNGTFPTSYQQVELHKTGGSARNFMRAYNKESQTHYFAPHKTGEDPVWKTYAYQEDVSTEIDDKIAADKAKGIWIGGVVKDTLNDDGHTGDELKCKNPKHYVEFRKTNVEADFFRFRQSGSAESSSITVHLHPESGLSSQTFRFTTADGLYQNKTFRINEKWRFYLRKGVYPYFEKIDDGTSGYVMEDEFNAKSGYSALVSGGGSTKTVTYGDNGKILKISNATVKVELLQGMNSDDKPHGYFKYINSHNADVAFEWYDRSGNRINNNVPSVCPKDTVVEVFADYAKDEYVLNFSQSKVISSVSEDKVQQIVSKSFDNLLQPGEGTQPFSKHPLPNQQGYLSTYSSVIYDDEDRLVIPRNAYDRTLIELFFEASKSTAYCTLPVATVELILGRIVQPEDIELGIALEQSTVITPGLYSATTPSNVPSTWAWNGKFIPLNTEGGGHNDPNNPSVWLSQEGEYVYSESEAGSNPSYDPMSISNLMSKDGQTWRYSLRRGYIMRDGSFVFDVESPYYAFVIKISGYQTPQSKIHTVFFNSGGIKLYPDAISAYMSANKLVDGLGTIINEMVTDEDLSKIQPPKKQGFINANSVSVDYPLDANGEQYRPVNVAVMVLDTDSLISGLNVTVSSDDDYDGHYNSVGAIAINSNGEWTTQSRRNGYRLNDGTNTYCVYSDSLSSWVLIVTSVDHNHVGSTTGGTPVNLYNDGQLPESFGDYFIENDLDSIESEYFTKADVNIDYHTNSEANSYFTVDFGSAKPAGIVFYK